MVGRKGEVGRSRGMGNHNKVKLWGKNIYILLNKTWNNTPIFHFLTCRYIIWFPLDKVA